MEKMMKKIKPCDPCPTPNWYRKKQKAKYTRDKQARERNDAMFEKMFRQEISSFPKSFL